MVRIHITGNSGSGKTTFANRLSTHLGIPVFGLDKIVWKPGWEKNSPEERKIKEEEIVKGNSWIIEGVCTPAQKEADIVVFIDVGYFKTLKQSFLRNLKYLLNGRPQLPDKCPEILMIFQQFFIIRRFHHTVGPQILVELKEMDKVVYIVNTQIDLEVTLFELCKKFGATKICHM